MRSIKIIIVKQYENPLGFKNMWNLFIFKNFKNLVKFKNFEKPSILTFNNR